MTDMAKSDKVVSETKQPVKYFADQFDDEEVLFVFHKHPIVMRKGLIFGLLGPLIGVLPALHFLTISSFIIGLFAGMLLGGLVFLPSWVGWHFSVFIVTDQRFIQIAQKGFFHRSVADLGLSQIQSVNYEVAGLQETLLGFGTIKMQTYVCLLYTSSFSTAQSTATNPAQAASYTITLSFDPTIFDITKTVTLSVPSITTTRSELNQPGDLFESAPSSTSTAGGQ